MTDNKKKLIIIGGILLLVILIWLFFSRNKTVNQTKVNVNNKDFDTKLEPTLIPTIIPTSTPRPTLTPTLISTLAPTVVPTLTPMPTLAPTATLAPTRIIANPTNRPTRIPTAIPTIDTNVYATGVVLSTNELVLKVNETKQITTRVEPNNVTDKSVYWSSENGNIATVTSDGQITGKNIGETVITARTSNNKTTLIKVTVVSGITITPSPLPVAYPSRIDLSLGRLILKVNEKKQLYVKYQPMNIVDKTVTWKTSDSNIVTVNNTGLVIGKKIGTATITVTTVNNLVRTATVFVIE